MSVSVSVSGWQRSGMKELNLGMEQRERRQRMSRMRATEKEDF